MDEEFEIIRGTNRPGALKCDRKHIGRKYKCKDCGVKFQMEQRHAGTFDVARVIICNDCKEKRVIKHHERIAGYVQAHPEVTTEIDDNGRQSTWFLS